MKRDMTALLLTVSGLTALGVSPVLEKLLLELASGDGAVVEGRSRGGGALTATSNSMA